jgi:hypothetical protein
MSLIEDMQSYQNSVCFQRPEPSRETQLANELRLEIMRAVRDAGEAGIGTNDIATVVNDYGSYLIRVRDYARKHKLGDIAVKLENADALAA